MVSAVNFWAVVGVSSMVSLMAPVLQSLRWPYPA